MKPNVKIGQPEFRTIRDLRELESLRAIWKSWPGTRDSDPAFFASAVRSRGSGCRPHVIVQTRDARPDAILVGLRECKKIPVKLGRFTISAADQSPGICTGGLRGNASDGNCVALLQEVMRSLEPISRCGNDLTCTLLRPSNLLRFRIHRKRI